MGKSTKENGLVRRIIDEMISSVETMEDCISVSKAITYYASEGYKVEDFEEELFYRKEQ